MIIIKDNENDEGVGGGEKNMVEILNKVKIALSQTNKQPKKKKKMNKKRYNVFFFFFFWY